MKYMIIGLSAVSAVFSMMAIVASIIAINGSGLTAIVLSIMKLTGTVDILWFSGLTTLSAIGTPLWMLFGGLFIIIMNYIFLAILAVVVDNQ